MKIKTKVSDEDIICLEIVQESLLLKSTTNMQRCKKSYQSSEPIFTKKSNHTKKITKSCTIQPDVTTQKLQVQKDKFLDETSIGKIYIRNSRTEPRKNKTSRENNDYNKNDFRHPDIE